MDAVFAIGSNGSGQLGIGHKEDVSVPKPILFHPGPPDSPIAKVAAGGNHTLLLSKSGQVFWSGDPSSGSCGLAGAPSIPVFQEARFVRDGEQSIGEVALLAATWEATILVTKDGGGKKTKVYSLGSGMKGELGLGEFIVRTPSATEMKSFPPRGTEVVDLSACMGHVVAVLSNGDAYGWGNCRKGQIGEPETVVHAPRKINGVPFKVSRAVCCKESTCLFGEPTDGRIHILGSDKWGIRTGAPQQVSSWINVGASWGNIFILRANGSLDSWGRDDHGQLPPSNLPPLKQITAGSEHVVAVSEAGDALAWGWGEHGNCGPNVDNNDVKGRWNVIASSKLIPPGSSISNIGAGCATSWICITAE